jgi:hypothetical protein
MLLLVSQNSLAYKSVYHLIRGVNYTKSKALANGQCRGAKPLCWGSGGIPRFKKSPKTGGYRELKSVADRSLFYLNLGKKIVI